MRLNAYLLAADPAWIEASVLSYYDWVDRIIVSYDQGGRGWSGSPLRLEDCLARLRAIDSKQKMCFRPGDYARPGQDPMIADTHQRHSAFEQAAEGADWVLQVDTDEVLPNPIRLIDVLGIAAARDIRAVEWPMRILYRKLHRGGYLEICQSNGANHFEYPGPIAIRPGCVHVDARRVVGPFLRPVVANDSASLQVSRPPGPLEHRIDLPNAQDAIIHNSWARRPASIRSKVASWGHNQGMKTWAYYHLRWKPSPLCWKWMRDLHPFARGLWPALKRCDNLPPEILARAVE